MPVYMQMVYLPILAVRIARIVACGGDKDSGKHPRAMKRACPEQTIDKYIPIRRYVLFKPINLYLTTNSCGHGVAQ